MAGPAINAQLQAPGGLAVDGAGNLFFADSNGTRVRKVSASGIITTVAGNGTRGVGRPSSMADQPPALHLRGYVGGVAVDGAGNLFIADAAIASARFPQTESSPRSRAAVLTSEMAGQPPSAQLYPWGVAVDGGG